MPKKKSGAERVIEFFQTEPIDSALTMFDVVKSVVARRRERERPAQVARKTGTRKAKATPASTDLPPQIA